MNLSLPLRLVLPALGVALTALLAFGASVAQAAPRAWTDESMQLSLDGETSTMLAFALATGVVLGVVAYIALRPKPAVSEVATVQAFQEGEPEERRKAA
jgi:hypothetical protein